MKIDDINASNFVDARSHEIQYLEAEIQKTRKKTLLNQRLPFHKRRRTRSKHINKKRFTRRKKTSQLQKHIYYHKRFEMIKYCDTNVPLKRRMKSDKFIYKSRHRGFLFVENYKSAVLYVYNENGIKLSTFEDKIKDIHENIIVTIFYENELYEVYKCTNYAVIIGIRQPEMLYYKMVKSLGIPISIMDGEYDFQCHVSNLIDNIVNQNEVLEINEDSNNNNNESTSIIDFEKIFQTIIPNKKIRLKCVIKDKNYMFENVLVFKSQGPVEKYKIIADVNVFRELHDFILKIKYIPVSIYEIFRIGTENNKIMYPFDYPESSFYTEIESAIYTADYEKWNRMPKGKRINYEYFKIEFPWFLPKNFGNGLKLYTTYYDVQKGAIKRMAVIYDKNEVVGYVLRASYCYTIGKCRCLCVLSEEPKEIYNARNTNSFDYTEITKCKI